MINQIEGSIYVSLSFDHEPPLAALSQSFKAAEGKIQMPTPLEKAREYLDALEADRQAALALSGQKAEEARLIKSRQEGFQAALALLAGATSTDDAGDLSVGTYAN
jgi:hypothetical protein